MNGDSLLPLVNGRRIPASELSVAFDRVKDTDRWKNPIDATIDIESDEDRSIIYQAIIFYTGSIATFTLNKNKQERVEADGYYVAIGA